ncbi:MAG TPA: efflux RND transporter periplasmic adaptor subunit [Thermoanaerobaculia bacterium]
MNEKMNNFTEELRRRWDAAPHGFRRFFPYVLVLLVGLLIGSTLLSRSSPPHDEGDGVRAAGAGDTENEATIWTCSMHPQIRQPAAGNCPICGMALIPIQTNDDDFGGGDQARLAVSERAAALMGVQVWPVSRLDVGDVSGEVRLSGTIGFDDTQVNDVFVRTEGQIERLYVNFENAAVSRGQRLADIYSPALVAASQELLQARRAAAAGGMADLAEAAASQLLTLGVTRGQVDRIIQTGQPLRTISVHSPADGVISDLASRQGEWLMPGARLMRVAGLSRVWAQFEAYERDLARLRVGTPMQFTVEAFPGETFSGAISFIDPVVDSGSRTASVRVQVANPGSRLKPGMLVRGLGGGVPSADAALVIPASAPLVTGRRAVVYVQMPGLEQPTFEARDVTLGERKGAYWEVVSGLTEGELVVVNGAFKIDSELQIRGRPSMMNPAVSLTVPESPAPAAASLSPAAGRQLEQIVAAYLNVTVALSRDDAPAAQRAARTLETTLKTAQLGDLSGAAAGQWSRARSELTTRAAAIAAASDIAVQRKELLPLSVSLESTVRAFPSDQVGPLFRAMCPMVEGREGSWLTRVEKVENPYWGAAMFDCGEIQGKVAG